jgi:hypothetical protein
MMCERGDFAVKDEPFLGYYYFSDERISRRRTDIAPNPEYRFDAILKNLLREAGERQIFIKDHAYHIITRADETNIGNFHSTFLIRHPAQSLPSLYARMPDFTLQETGYAEQFRLFELVGRMGGTTPVVIDADDLVDDPESTIAAYCKAVGIPFMPCALSWSGALPAAMNADWGGWYSHLEKSSGFSRQANPDYLAADDAAMREAYEYCLPFYRAMHEHRLRIC